MIDQARAASARGLTVETVGPADLPLSSLDRFVDHAVAALRGGRGFVLLRGFPTSELTPTEVELAYVGLGLRLGIPVGQDKSASLLGHVEPEPLARRNRHFCRLIRLCGTTVRWPAILRNRRGSTAREGRAAGCGSRRRGWR